MAFALVVALPWRSTWLRPPYAGVLAALVATAFLVRIIPAWILQVETADVASFRVMAEAGLRGDNLYAYRVLYWYTPFAQFHPVWSLLIANVLGLRFDFVFKIPMAISDAGTVALIFWYLTRRGVPVIWSVGWAGFWALNPVSILVSAFHGAPHSMVGLLVATAFVAAALGEASPRRTDLLAISALVLGLAIAFRTIPILFLPCFLILATRTVRETLLYTALSLFPSAVSILPYLFYAGDTLIRETVVASGTPDYSGYTDFGWVSILRSAALLAGRPRQFVFTDQPLLDATKLLFLFAYGVALLLMPYFRREALGRALMLSSLLFYALFAGVASQYLVWVLPLAILLRERLTVPYTVAAAAALIAFYALYYPPILFGRYSWLIPRSDATLTIYWIANALLEVACLAWAAGVLIREPRVQPHPWQGATGSWINSLERVWLSPWYRKGLWLAASITGVLLVRAIVRAQEVFRPVFGL